MDYSIQHIRVPQGIYEVPAEVQLRLFDPDGLANEVYQRHATP